ncbi:hypothetical protein COY16_04805 [Candidatus Roizmanbacteria bacterium CG_4_10_14_0_2_um_filter_39_13]|uniref:Uncharacterized protein n=1 Tax=Candidatus Roizmanbacteria bacterium CG_4_10_14_0_2_um_filter_39_13 TaxID=1974825 RepID=A0A2M7TWQ5_9BACT|nr:MAG: hypothetical protein COY16_04805 [Candidatus Roizmanbacteria bacterium CG_4_10_14_0_2_um_filter_39_13]
MPEEDIPKNVPSIISLSTVTNNLLSAFHSIKQKPPTDEFTKLSVSQTVSFLALVYEKVRNAIEYREDHLIRRAAIERILKRRLSLNSEAKGEAENILRELMWARYFPNGSLGAQDIQEIQHILDRYINIRKQLLTGRIYKTKAFLADFLLQLVTAEIEEHLSPAISQQEADFGYYIFQTLKDKVKIEDVQTEQKDTYLFIAIEKAYRKSDQAYQRYHLFRLFYKPFACYTNEEISTLIPKLSDIFHKIDSLISNPTVEKLVRFTRKQLPPFLIIFSLFRENKEKIDEILLNKSELWTYVEKIAREKYALVRSRLNILAFRSLVYIFITKMIFALILEVPVSQYLYNEVNYWAIGINSLAPPLFMLLIILSVSVPGEDNTKRLFLRIVDIIDKDSTFEKSIAFITKKVKNRRPVLAFGFTFLYVSTFIVTLYLIHLGLKMMNFNILSEALFIFFISVVAFFAYRIKQLANMYRLTEKGSFFSPIFDFFFMPILSMGKLFSEGVSKINFFIVIFDFIIEAPFKLIIEVIEEWISFVRLKKEDII